MCLARCINRVFLRAVSFLIFPAKVPAREPLLRRLWLKYLIHNEKIIDFSHCSGLHGRLMYTR